MKYNGRYAFEIPEKEIVKMLEELAWDTLSYPNENPLVEFSEAGDTEDSFFTVLGATDGLKTSFADAVCMAYQRMLNRNEKREREELARLKAKYPDAI